MLRGTPHDNSLSALKLLADLPVKKQRERAQELKAGAPPTILRKIKRAKYRNGSYVRTGDGVLKLVGRDICGQFQAVSHSGGPVTLVPLSAIQGLATKQEWLTSRPAPNQEQSDASLADAGAGNSGVLSDAKQLADRPAEPLVNSDTTAPHLSDSQEIAKSGQHDPQMPPVATDVQTVFDAMTDGWEYDQKLKLLEKYFGQDSVNTMLRLIKASDLNEFKQFVQTYIEERKNA
jgi:hypothetical protein